MGTTRPILERSANMPFQSFQALSWFVVWAYTLAPIAFVSALRETGIVFAVLIGVLIFGEKLNLARMAATISTLIGVVMIKIHG